MTEITKDYVLFSPIGSSDPIRGNYDGPMLHIIRHYKPSKVYLFLTKTMFERDEKDNRYEVTAKKLCPNIEFKKLIYKEIKKVNDFLLFDEPYALELKKIREENPNSIILCNISSGTGQMQSSLYVFAATESVEVELISVYTSSKAPNNSKVVSNDYDIETEYMNNYNNETDFENRCENVTPQNIKKLFASQIIKQYVVAYNYKAAILAYKDTKDFFDNTLGNLLNGMQSRLNLQKKDSLNQFKQCGIDSKLCFPFHKKELVHLENLYEYILYLQTRQQSDSAMDFIRAITPCLENLFEKICTEIFKFDFSKTSKKIKDDSPKWNREMFNKKYPQILQLLDTKYAKIGLREDYISTDTLLYIIEYYANLNAKTDLFLKCQKLRAFEQTIRNKVTHTITSYTEAELINETNLSIKQVLDLIKDLFGLLVTFEVNWNSYEIVNNEIIKHLVQ